LNELFFGNLEVDTEVRIAVGWSRMIRSRIVRNFGRSARAARRIVVRTRISIGIRSG